MSRVSEADLHNSVKTLDEEFPGHHFQLQSQGTTVGVWMGKPGRWAIEGFNTNSDLRDAISALWTGKRLENERLLNKVKALRDQSAIALGQGTDLPELYATLLAELGQLLMAERYDGW